ncbi:hypothetical protein BsWGS_27895 [Bradybaena similaris]
MSFLYLLGGCQGHEIRARIQTPPRPCSSSSWCSLRNRLGPNLANAVRINYASPQMSSSSSSFALPAGSDAQRGEGKLCNSPVEMLLLYCVRRNVFTPSLNSTDSHSRGSDELKSLGLKSLHLSLPEALTTTNQPTTNT